MNTLPTIVWKGMQASPALEERVREDLAALHHAWPQIIAARVALERPHRHKRHGNHFQVKVEVTVPGKVLCVTRDPPQHTNSEDPYAAVSEAFETITRRLKDWSEVRHRIVKDHPLSKARLRAERPRKTGPHPGAAEQPAEQGGGEPPGADR